MGSALVGALDGVLVSTRSLAFAPDGTRIAVSRGPEVHLLSCPELRTIRVLSHGSASIADLEFGPGGKRLATLAIDGSVHLWRVSTGRYEMELRGLEQRGVGVGFGGSGERVVAAGDARELCTWPAVRGLAFAGDDMLVVGAAIQDMAEASVGEGLLWDLASDEPWIFAHHSSSVYALEFTPDGRSLVLGLGPPFGQTGEGQVEVWDVERRALRLRLRGHGSEVFALAVSPDGGLLASGSAALLDHGASGELYLWDLDAGTRIAELAQGTGISAARFSADGSRLFASQTQGGLLGFQTEGGARLFEEPVGIPTVHTFAPAPDASWAAVAGADEGGGPRGFLRWVSLGGTPPPQPAEAVPLTSRVAFVAGATRVATAGSDGLVRLWDAGTGELAGELEHEAWVLSLDELEGGRLLTTAMALQEYEPDGGWVTIWDLDGLEILKRRRLSSGVWSGAALDPSGTRLALAHFDGTVEIVSVPELEPLFTLREPHPTGQEDGDSRCFSAAATPDGRLVAVGDGGGSVILVERGSPGTARRLQLFDAPVAGCALSPDGLLLAASSSSTLEGAELPGENGERPPEGPRSSGALVLLEVEGGRERFRVEYPGLSFGALALSPDGGLLAACAIPAADAVAPASVFLLDARTGATAGQLPAQAGIARGLAFVDGGASLVTVADDSILRRFELAAGALRQQLDFGPHARPLCLAVSPGGRTLAMGSFDGWIRFLDPLTLESLGTFRAHESSVGALAFSPDGRSLASGQTDAFHGEVRVVRAAGPTAP